MRHKDGHTVREHLEAAARRGNAAAISALMGPECPEALAYLWQWFQVLHGARRFGMAGPERISLVEIDAANRLLGWNVRPYEVEALTWLDLAWLAPDAGTDTDA